LIAVIEEIAGWRWSEC